MKNLTARQIVNRLNKTFASFSKIERQRAIIATIQELLDNRKITKATAEAAKKLV